MTSQVMTTEQLRTSRQAAHAAPKPVEVGLTSLEGFELAQRIAKMLAASSMVPEAYRDTLKVKDGKDQNGNWIYRDEPNPNGVANCIIAVNMASRLNADPLMIMQNLFPIEGRPSWSSQFVIAAINTSGKYSPLRFDVEDRGEVEVTYTTKEWKWNPQQRKSLPEEKTHTVKLRNMVCKAWAIETGTGERLESAEISMEMAVKEGWYQKNGSKWQTMPEQMLRYRAASFFGRIYAPELLMGIKTYEEEMDAIIDVTPEPVNTAPQTLDSIKQNVVKEIPVEAAPAEEKPKRTTKSKDAKLIEKFTENLKTCTKESEFADLRIQVINEDGLNLDQQEELMRQINERAQEYLASENESTDNNLSVDELKRLQQEAEALVQQKKQPSSAEMKKEYAKALNTAKSLANILDIEEQIENDSALTQADFQYLQANIEQVRGKFEQQQAPTVDPLKSGSVKSGLTLLISDAKNGEDLRQVAQQMNAAKPNLTSEHQQELLQAYQQKKKLIEDQMDMFPGN